MSRSAPGKIRARESLTKLETNEENFDMSTEEKYVDDTVNAHKVVVWSKSYCPFCKKTKELFKSLNVDIHVIELDQVDNGEKLQAVLKSKTGQNSVPSVWINKQHIGGCDDTHAKHKDGSLQKIIANQIHISISNVADNDDLLPSIDAPPKLSLSLSSLHSFEFLDPLEVAHQKLSKVLAKEKTLDSKLRETIQDQLKLCSTLKEVLELIKSDGSQIISERFVADTVQHEINNIYKQTDGEESDALGWAIQRYGFASSRSVQNKNAPSALDMFKSKNFHVVNGMISPRACNNSNEAKFFSKDDPLESATKTTSSTTTTTVSSEPISFERLGSSELQLSFALKSCLSKVYSWSEFNIFDLEKKSESKPLSVLCSHLFQVLGFFEMFKIPRVSFSNFIEAVESGYLDNKYHNALHASDVVQNIFWLTQQTAISKALRPTDLLAAIIAAAIHDFKHPGTTNPFNVETESELAIRYNDISVLENMHAADGYALLKKFGVLCNVSRADRKYIREMIVSMVLATDMSKHKHHVAHLTSVVAHQKRNNIGFLLEKKEDRKLLLETCMHASDLGNPGKPWDVSKEWVDLLFQEFWLQGDQEKKLKIKVEPMHDRAKGEETIAKSQVYFGANIVEPFFLVINSFCEIKPITTNLQENLKIWKNLSIMKAHEGLEVRDRSASKQRSRMRKDRASGLMYVHGGVGDALSLMKSKEATTTTTTTTTP